MAVAVCSVLVHGMTAKQIFATKHPLNLNLLQRNAYCACDSGDSRQKRLCNYLFCCSKTSSVFFIDFLFFLLTSHMSKQKTTFKYLRHHNVLYSSATKFLSLLNLCVLQRKCPLHMWNLSVTGLHIYWQSLLYNICNILWKSE